MKTVRTGVVALLCLGGLALGLAACGGSGGSDFTAEANAICRERVKAFVSVFDSPAGAARTQKDAVEAEQSYLAQDERAERRLAALEAPADEKSAFAAFLSAAEKATAAQRMEEKAVQEGDKSQFGKRAEERTEADKATTKAAAAVPGLDECAERLSKGEERAVAQTIEVNEAKREPSQCTEFLVENVAVNLYKSVAGCEKAQAHAKPGELPRSVDVEVVEGNDGIAATAYVTFHGGEADGNTSEYGMAYEDGKWKLAFFQPKEG